MKTFLALMSFGLILGSCGPGGTAEDQHKHEFRMKQAEKQNSGSPQNTPTSSPEATNPGTVSNDQP